MFRLEALRLAAQTLSPNADSGALIARAQEIYLYIKTGKNEQNVEAN